MGPEWPTKDQLKQLLLTRSGRPVSMQDIETDVFTLLSTGLCIPGLCIPEDLYIPKNLYIPGGLYIPEDLYIPEAG